MTCQRQRAILRLYYVQRVLVLFGGADVKDWLADREEWRTVQNKTIQLVWDACGSNASAVGRANVQV